MQQAARAGASVHQSLRVGWLAEAEMLTGRLPRAVALAEEALEHARVNRERGAEAHVHRILGDIAVAMEPADRAFARRHYGEALSIGSELEMRPLEARCCLAIGRLGGDESAPGPDEWFARARRLFEALGMSDPSTGARAEPARDLKLT